MMAISALLFKKLMVKDFSEFTPVLWDENPYERIHMLEDLFEKIELAGMSKQDVVKVLGENECNMLPDKYVYTLGSKNKYMFTYFYYLEIFFDEYECVKNFNVHMD